MRTTSQVPKANVLGVGVGAINLAQATRLILEAVRQNRKGHVAVTGVHGVSEAQTDSEFRRILNAAFLNTPDGMPICWVGRFQGFKAMDRVSGPDDARTLRRIDGRECSALFIRRYAWSSRNTAILSRVTISWPLRLRNSQSPVSPFESSGRS
jgi:UDP-N-acetyl-D-mannosaminuronic acid transferase (WecB/TagA/CpsF family)